MSALFPILVILALPVAIGLVLTIYFIYRHFYNKHVNKVLGGETGLKKWIPPYAVVLISIAAILVIFVSATVGLVRNYMFQKSSGGTLDYRVLEDGSYQVITDDMLTCEYKDTPHIEITVYKSDLQIFADVKVKDPVNVKSFKACVDCEETEILYKNEDNEFMDHVPLFFEEGSRSKDIDLNVLGEDGAVLESIVINRK